MNMLFFLFLHKPDKTISRFNRTERLDLIINTQAKNEPCNCTIYAVYIGCFLEVSEANEKQL